MQVSPDAEKVRQLREERCWSQEHLAQAAGVSLRTVQRVESGERASSASMMAIAAAFDTEVGSIAMDPVAAPVARNDPERARAALRLSFLIVLASYVFCLFVFAAISFGDGNGRFEMFYPTVWFGVGVAGHGLTVVIVELVTRFKTETETASSRGASS
ncbi:helix-turn-helix domain-containing protein [Parvularcula dongshanensis]|uniref:Transcriptional regulator with XRE-family HTH domain n=1 Tax=Parvularcula dongshanensis TaxID=1173995 RepID=A0A840I4U8_9PROT|nr:helix-turn-helix transcriptional regulator [Parvularcula dongshanensis]MBB4659807.1 transcriptional regulator with XRE-family HTH domain [Parvularcula dongshanensis]